MVNALIKINDDFQVDFSFIDKIQAHMVGIRKEELLDALKVSAKEVPAEHLHNKFSPKKSHSISVTNFHQSNQPISSKSSSPPNNLIVK